MAEEHALRLARGAGGVDEPRDVIAVRVLEPSEYAGGRGRGMNGTHRSRGIWIARGATGTGRAALPAPPGSLVGVAPWLAAAMGLASPDASNADESAVTDARSSVRDGSLANWSEEKAAAFVPDGWASDFVAKAELAERALAGREGVAVEEHDLPEDLGGPDP